MKKHLFFLILITALSFSSGAQTTIPNGDFENWINLGQATETPADWNSNKDGGGFASFGPQTCFQDSNAHSGQYCVKLVTASIAGNIVPGTCTTGIVEAPTSSPADGYIADTGVVRQAFTGRPDSIVFWYKYTEVDTDYPTVNVVLHVGDVFNPETPSNGNHTDDTADVIGTAVWIGPAGSQSTWARVSIPMTYANTNTPQYILLGLSASSNQTAGASGSTLWVDDMQAIYGTSGINNVAEIPAKVYWNDGHITADLRNTAMTSATIQVINMNGQKVLECPLTSDAINTIALDAADAVYLYRVSSAAQTVTGKIVKQ